MLGQLAAVCVPAIVRAVRTPARDSNPSKIWTQQYQWLNHGESWLPVSLPRPLRRIANDYAGARSSPQEPTKSEQIRGVTNCLCSLGIPRRFANEPAGLQIVRCCYSKIGHETPHLPDPAEAPIVHPGAPAFYVAALCSFPTCGTAVATADLREAFSNASMSSNR